MKAIFLALVSFVLLNTAPPLRATDIKEADYPVQYEVMMTGKESKMVVNKQCTMTLRDKSKPDTAINVSRKGIGSCQVLEDGKVYKGRENTKKNEIEIVLPVGDSKARVEVWQIDGKIDLQPRADRPTS